MVFKENIIMFCYMDILFFFGIINKFWYYMMIVIDIIFFFWVVIGLWIFDEFCVCWLDLLVISFVKRCSEVVLCKNGDFWFVCEISIFYFLKLISVFMRKYDVCIVMKLVKKNWRIKRYWFFL